MHLVLASVVQRFDMVLHDPSYSLELKQTLTIKPKNFYIKAAVRPGKRYAFGAAPSPDYSLSAPLVDAQSGKEGLKRLYVCYGSNTGSCESFAQRVASAAISKGEYPVNFSYSK
jgi:cytochrome P450/NADPH-cytochrome P450 reductase